METMRQTRIHHETEFEIMNTRSPFILMNNYKNQIERYLIAQEIINC